MTYHFVHYSPSIGDLLNGLECVTVYRYKQFLVLDCYTNDIWQRGILVRNLSLNDELLCFVTLLTTVEIIVEEDIPEYILRKLVSVDSD